MIGRPPTGFRRMNGDADASGVVDLYQIEMEWICRPVIVYYQRDHRHHRPNRRKKLQVGSYSIRKVCITYSPHYLPLT